MTVFAEAPSSQPQQPEPTATTSGVAETEQGSTKEERSPPQGLSDGGVWTRRKCVGDTTIKYCVLGCFCLIIPGFCALLNPMDERDVYVIDGKAYLDSGECIGCGQHCNKNLRTSLRCRRLCLVH